MATHGRNVAPPERLGRRRRRPPLRTPLIRQDLRLPRIGEYPQDQNGMSRTAFRMILPAPPPLGAGHDRIPKFDARQIAAANAVSASRQRGTIVRLLS